MAEKKCTHCNDKIGGEKVSLVSAESEATRQQIVIKRLISVIILLAVMLFGSNLAWITYESQFETIKETYTVRQNTKCGNNNCVIKEGEINNGTPND